MTTQISKIKVRQGNFTDLPLLDAGELGYAIDQRRLFIGNNTVSVGTGNGVLTQFVVSTDVSDNSINAVFLDGAQVNAADYAIQGTTLTFATAPSIGAVITINFNSEIDILKDGTTPHVISLAANGSSAETGFQIDTTQSNAVVMDYTLQSSNGARVGQLRFITDTNLSTVAIDDNYTETGSVDVVFTLDIATANTMKLMYTDNDNAISTFKYTYQLWNSNN